MHILKTSVKGNPNVGLFGIATDNFVLASPNMEHTELLSDKVVNITLAGTDLIGLFAAGNSNGLIVPYMITKPESAALSGLKKKFGVNVLQLKCKETATGNLIVANDKGAIISPLLKSDAKKISETLGVEAVVSRLIDMEIPGSYCAATNKGFLLSLLAEEKDYKLVKSVLRVDGDIGSVNFGSIFVSSGVLANSKGALVGSQTTGFETARIDEALGFVK